jgi:hypothetical protein
VVIPPRLDGTEKKTIERCRILELRGSEKKTIERCRILELRGSEKKTIERCWRSGGNSTKNDVVSCLYFIYLFFLSKRAFL